MTRSANDSLNGNPDAPMLLHVRVVASSGGGPDKTILRSAAYAPAAGLRMGAAYIHPRRSKGIDTIRAQAAACHCPLWTVPETGPIDPRTIAALLKLCRRQRVGIWHGHDYKSNLLGLLLRRFHHMRLVTSVHGWTDETMRMRLYGRIDRWCLPRYDQVIAVSGLLHEACLRAGVQPQRLSYVSNGIDPAEYQRRNHCDQARQRMQLDPNQLAIGVIGRLSIEKGVDRALQLVAALRRDWPRIHLHLIGDGPQRQALVKLAERLQISDRVTFWGWQRDLKDFYELIDLLLLPSHTEGLPNVVLEAMSMRTAVAATNVGDIGMLLDQGRCGLILADDEQAWPRQLAPMFLRPALRAELAARGRARIERHFTFAQRMAKVMAVYRRLGSEAEHPLVRRRAA